MEDLNKLEEIIKKMKKDIYYKDKVIEGYIINEEKIQQEIEDWKALEYSLEEKVSQLDKEVEVLKDKLNEFKNEEGIKSQMVVDNKTKKEIIKKINKTDKFSIDQMSNLIKFGKDYGLFDEKEEKKLEGMHNYLKSSGDLSNENFKVCKEMLEQLKNEGYQINQLTSKEYSALINWMKNIKIISLMEYEEFTYYLQSIDNISDLLLPELKQVKGALVKMKKRGCFI